MAEPTILVTGDVTIDWNIAHRQEDPSKGKEWNNLSQSSISPMAGSALLLSDLMKSLDVRYKVVSPSVDLDRISTLNDAFVQTYSEWQSDDSHHWSVARYLGAEIPSKQKRFRISFSGNPDLIIIDDANLGFRDDKRFWPPPLTRRNTKSLVVLKMTNPIASGRLFNHLTKSFGSRLTVVMTVNDLRQHDVQISSQLSWERTAQQLTWELKYNQKLKPLKQTGNIIVSFGAAGALCYSNETSTSTLLFDPDYMESEWPQLGAVTGGTATLTAGIALGLLRNKKMTQAIQHGMNGMRILFTEGYYQRGKTLEFPFGKIRTALKQRSRHLIETEVETQSEERWNILASAYSQKLDQLAKSIVLDGPDASISDVPKGKFGALFSVDRTEIESLRAISQLISEYCARGDSKPLSFAVFGPPGAGKSFAVSQLSKVVAADQISDRSLTFNLSQLDSPDDLADAFHQVRDIGLTGKIPLVFLDEFDTALDSQKLGWLRYFLAPMQDGEFQEGQITHPIGRAIFVFAGGTSHNFEQFSAAPENIKGNEAKARAWKDAKVPDFVSRLRGFLNVLGPNRQNEKDRFFKIRRALLLRSMIDRSASLIRKDKPLAIDDGVLRALLEVEQYKHGSRSLEAILKSSRLEGAKKFTRSTLPASDQLDMHVNAAEFLGLVRTADFNDKKLEDAAKKQHALYRASLRDIGYTRYGKTENKKTGTHPSQCAWEKLDHHHQEQNREAIRDLPRKLARHNFIIVPRIAKQPLYEFEDDDLTALSIEEHKRWCHTKLTNGWRYGPKRDNDKKLHHDLVDWEELSEEAKEKDKDVIRQIPVILSASGLHVKKDVSA